MIVIPRRLRELCVKASAKAEPYKSIATNSFKESYRSPQFLSPSHAPLEPVRRKKNASQSAESRRNLSADIFLLAVVATRTFQFYTFLTSLPPVSIRAHLNSLFSICPPVLIVGSGAHRLRFLASSFFGFRLISHESAFI